MQAVLVSSIHSEEFETLMDWYRDVRAPYGLHDVQKFNAIYREIYPKLRREERKRAEDIVDALIAGLADPDYAPRIYGVV